MSTITPNLQCTIIYICIITGGFQLHELTEVNKNQFLLIKIIHILPIMVVCFSYMLAFELHELTKVNKNPSRYIKSYAIPFICYYKNEIKKK